MIDPDGRNPLLLALIIIALFWKHDEPGGSDLRPILALNPVTAPVAVLSYGASSGYSFGQALNAHEEISKLPMVNTGAETETQLRGLEKARSENLEAGILNLVAGASVAATAESPRSPKVGPAATIPDEPGAFLQGGNGNIEGFYSRSTGTTYLVRAGPAGRFGDPLFSSQAEAVTHARQLSSTGEAEIRAPRALVRVWTGGAQGNPVNTIRVFEVPTNTPNIVGVVGPQLEGGTVFGGPVTYPGGGPQVAIDWTVKLQEVASFPVNKP